MGVFVLKPLAMIEKFFEKLIEELGATGLLVLGLYFILHHPLREMAKRLRSINHSLTEIVELAKSMQKE